MRYGRRSRTPDRLNRVRSKYKFGLCFLKFIPFIFSFIQFIWPSFLVPCAVDCCSAGNTGHSHPLKLPTRAARILLVIARPKPSEVRQLTPFCGISSMTGAITYRAESQKHL